MRVCLIGETGVGKTTLCKQIINDRDIITQPTIGCEFYSITHKQHQIELWDTAGQERYQALLPMYIRRAKIIIYVISATNLEKENYPYWINYINNSAELNHQIIIVLTKCDINKNYTKDIIYLKNFLNDNPIIYKFNNNISKKLLNTIISSYNNIPNPDNNTSDNLIDIDDNYIDFNDKDFRNNKPKCC